MEETERSLHDAIMIVRRAIKVGKASSLATNDYNYRFILSLISSVSCGQRLIILFTMYSKLNDRKVVR